MADEIKVDLWKYLPPFLKQFRELDKLLLAEEPEFQEFLFWKIHTLENLFIESAHDEGLKQYEKLLGLYPLPGESLETRRQNVFSKWFATDKYTMKTLLQRLQMLQGNDNVQLEWDEINHFFLHVITRLEQPGQVETLCQILETMIPANIGYQSNNMIEIAGEISMSFVMAGSITATLFNTNDIVGVFRDDIPLSAANGVGVTQTLFNTNDIVGTFPNELPLEIASGISQTDIHFITD